MTPPEFLIRHAALEAIIAHAHAARPAECCGMLLGKAASIEDHIEARRVARGRGLDVIGFYHSHPHSPARPSPTDIAEATYPDAVYLIVSLAGAAPNARLFRIERGAATELPLRSIG